MNIRACAHGFLPRRRTRKLGFGAAACGVLIVLTVAALASDGQVSDGSPFRGRQLFEEKRCSTCHSVWGHGGTLGPEISVAVAGKTFYELVGDFWNHTPQMIDEVERHGYPWPTLDPAEMADMLSYLYYLRLFDEPGNVERGANAYARLQCGTCHTLGGRGGPGGGSLDRFSAFPAPTPLAQAMWNAGPRMQQDQLQRGVSIPQLGGQDMADLQAYIRAEGHRSGREVTLESLPNPDGGASVYRAKGCGACHDRAGRTAPDLKRSTLSKTVSEITSLLWNHSYAMGAQMIAQGVAFPRFRNHEMSDLIAHLYFLGYAGEDGDPKRGAAVFGRKGCVACHKEGVAGTPSLSDILRRTDSAGLASSMWNHAPQMHSTMAERASFWPKFEPGEMRDLAAYLRDRRSGRASAGQAGR
ncbi:MAG: c-type cytochrome [Acidobacteriota bacterium]